MIHRNVPLILSSLAAFLFWPAMLIIGELRPEYSQMTKAVSELGVIDAPYAAIFNTLGFFVPGVLLAACGAKLSYSIYPQKSSLWWLLTVSGVCFAGTAIPAEMIDGSFDMDSVLTQTHMIMVLGSGFLWIIAIFIAHKCVSESHEWQQFKGVIIVLSLVCFLLVLANPFSGLLPITAALGQRIAFVGYFLWFLVMSILEARIKNNRSSG
jgi:hypothetical membrane protein